MPENVAEAVPPVMNDSTSAPSPLRALNMPTVANLIRAIVARPILPTKPSDIILLVDRVPFISAMFMAAVLTQPTIQLHIPAQLSWIIQSMALPIPEINLGTVMRSGISCANGVNSSINTPAQSVVSPVA